MWLEMVPVSFLKFTSPAIPHPLHLSHPPHLLPVMIILLQLPPTSTHEGYSGITITELSDTSVLSSTHGLDPLSPSSVLPGVKSGSSLHTLLSSSQPRLAPQLAEVMPLQSSSCRFPIAPDCEVLVKLQLRHFSNCM